MSFFTVSFSRFAPSRTNSETPRKRSQSKFWISRFRTVGDPETLENKADSLPRLISELCYPQYGWYPFLFWKGPLHGTARAGHEIPNSTGGTTEFSSIFYIFLQGNTRWVALQYVLIVLVFCSCPGFHLGLGPSDCSPGLAFCFTGPLDIAWICCPQLPRHPCKNGTHSTCFYSTGGHTPISEVILKDLPETRH